MHVHIYTYIWSTARAIASRVRGYRDSCQRIWREHQASSQRRKSRGTTACSLVTILKSQLSRNFTQDIC